MLTKSARTRISIIKLEVQLVVTYLLAAPLIHLTLKANLSDGLKMMVIIMNRMKFLHQTQTTKK